MKMVQILEAKLRRELDSYLDNRRVAASSSVVEVFNTKAKLTLR